MDGGISRPATPHAVACGPRLRREARLDKRLHNQHIFRAANERLRDRLADTAAVESLPFICECADAHCLEVMELPLATYREVRAVANRFFVVPGHDVGGERIVGSRDGIDLVEKQGKAGREAEEAAQ
ncbi:MAG: hypothetical protein ABR583_04540 [Gaiellaceae bacterium]